MENNEVKEHLAAIVRQHGQGIVEDPPKLQGLLKDLVGTHRREINVLMQALRANVPGELLRSSGPTAITAERLAGKLQEETGLSPDSAKWAVATWGNAMGILVEFESSPDSADEKGETSDKPGETDRGPATTPAPPPVIDPPPDVRAGNAPAAPISQWPPVPARRAVFPTGVIVLVSLVVVSAIGGIIWATGHGNNYVSSGSTSGIPSPTISPTSTSSPDDTSSPSPSGSETSSPTSSPSSPAAEIGQMADGVYTDGPKMFSFTPPAGWLMTPDTSQGSVSWTDTADASTGAQIDLRVVSPQGTDLKDVVAKTAAALQSKLNFKSEPAKDFASGDLTGQLLRGTYTDKSGNQQIAMVIALHSGKEVLVTMGSLVPKFDEIAKNYLDGSLKSWKWLDSH